MLWLSFVHGACDSPFYSAEGAVSGTDIPQNKKGCRLTRKTLTNVGTKGILTDGMQIQSMQKSRHA
jgi:hypothetical protein